MEGGGRSVLRLGRAIMSRLRDEFDQLELKKVDLWVQELKSPHKIVLGIIEEEADTLIEESFSHSPIPTSPPRPQLSLGPARRRRPLARAPSLGSIAEAVDEGKV